jgi:hypothetical protein
MDQGVDDLSKLIFDNDLATLLAATMGTTLAHAENITRRLGTFKFTMRCHASRCESRDIAVLNPARRSSMSRNKVP